MRISDWSSDVCSSDLEDAVSDQRPQFEVDRAFVLDREVGNAASRIQPVGGGDRAGGTDLDAARTGAAMVAGGRVDRQRQVQVDLAEEEPAAAILVHQAGVLADPAQAGVDRKSGV